jgi:hypothetical protein
MCVCVYLLARCHRGFYMSLMLLMASKDIPDDSIFTLVALNSLGEIWKASATPLGNRNYFVCMLKKYLCPNTRYKSQRDSIRDMRSIVPCKNPLGTSSGLRSTSVSAPRALRHCGNYFDSNTLLASGSNSLRNWTLNYMFFVPLIGA